MWWNRKPKPELTPGLCECNHNRSSHDEGVGECNVRFPDRPGWGCACLVYIRKKDSDDPGPEPVTPTPGELEKLYQR